MIYAPVLIPTCNRYKHLENCLVSLSKCTWADQTDVYVAVDYPGKEEHREGYLNVKKYLDCCGNLGFKSLNVIYRESNYLFSGKGNFKTLREDIFKSYDRYIYSEDDNVFSPCFLMFMNKALEKFENDETVLAINGYQYITPLKCKGNNFIRQNVDFSAWGYGIWKKKFEKYLSPISEKYFYNNLRWNNFWKVLKCGNNRSLRFLEYAYTLSPPQDDNTFSCVMNLEELDVVSPVVSLVRNMGWDSSGIHCSPSQSYLADSHTNQIISEDDAFEFKGTGKEYYKENKRSIITHSIAKVNNFKYLASLILWFYDKIILKKKNPSRLICY